MKNVFKRIIIALTVLSLLSIVACDDILPANGEITLTSHSTGDTVSGTITIEGNYSGDVEDIYISYSTVVDDIATITPRNASWSYVIDTTTLTGSVVITIEAFKGTEPLDTVKVTLTVDNSTTTPTGTLTFTTPTDNTTISGASVILSGAITGDTDAVQLTVDSAAAVSATVDTTAMTWTYTLNTTGLTDGSITVSVEPFSGMTSLGSPVTKSLTVDNSGTTPTGSATLTSHVANQVVSGTIDLEGDTSGNTDQVKISAGTVYTDVDATMNPSLGEWSFAFDTTQFVDANTTITIDAYQGTTKLDTMTLSLLIDNAGVQPSGTVSITDPYDGEEIFGTMVLVEGSYTGDIDTVEVNVGSEAPATATLNSSAHTWSYTFDSTSFTDGTLHLSVEALAGTTPLDTDSIDVTVANDSTINLSGTINVDTGGPQSGTMLIGVMDDTSDTAVPVAGIEVGFTGGTYAYSIDVAPGMYYVGAFIDEDDDDEWDSTEWTGSDNNDGSEGRPILNNYATDTSGIDFLLMYFGPDTYDLGGSVTLGGGAPTTGDIWFGLFTETPDYDSVPVDEYWDTLDGSSSFDYTFFDVPDGDYTVAAYIDSSEDGNYQPGEYTGGGPSNDPDNPQPLLNLNSDVYDNDFTIDWADTNILIGGTITGIPVSGHIYVGLFDSDYLEDSMVEGLDFDYSSGEVYFEFITAPGSYLVKAFVDMNDNGFDDPDDYKGADNYDNGGQPALNTYDNNTSNVDFSLNPPEETYSLEGTVTISESDSLGRMLPTEGDIYLNLYQDGMEETQRIDWMQVEDYYTGGTYFYHYEWVEPGTYYVLAWIDSTGDGDYQSGHDHYGWSGEITLGPDASGEDFTVADFETIEISGSITVPGTEDASGTELFLEFLMDGAPEPIKESVPWADYSATYAVDLPPGRYLIRAFIDKDSDGAVSANDVLGYGTLDPYGAPIFEDFFEDTTVPDITLEANTIEPDGYEQAGDTYGPFTVPEWIDGDAFYEGVFTIDNGADVDYLQFNNAAYSDFTLEISTLPVGNGLDVNTAIEVLDAAGNPATPISLDQDIDSGSGDYYSVATFDLSARESFILKVSSEDGTSTGEYAVRITRTPISHVVVE